VYKYPTPGFVKSQERIEGNHGLIPPLFICVKSPTVLRSASPLCCERPLAFLFLFRVYASSPSLVSPSLVSPSLVSPSSVLVIASCQCLPLRLHHHSVPSTPTHRQSRLFRSPSLRAFSNLRDHGLSPLSLPTWGTTQTRHAGTILHYSGAGGVRDSHWSK